MTPSRRLGYRQDVPKLPTDRPDLLLLSRVTGGDPPPAANIPDRYLGPVLDQGGVGSCTAHAVALTLRAAHVKAGQDDPPLASRAWIYYWARLYDGNTAHDAGAQLRNCYRAIVRHGYPSEALWPYVDDVKAACKLPRLQATWAAWGNRANPDAPEPTVYRRIPEHGSHRTRAVRLAIAAGLPVAFGTMVTEDFVQGDPGAALIDRPGASDLIAGGHAMTIVGYDADHFLVRNSWGRSWGLHGEFFMSERYLTWDMTSDLWVCERTPPLP